MHFWQHLSLNKQTGHLKNGKQAGKKKEEAGKHYPKAKVWGIVRAALAVVLTIQVNCTCPLAQPVEKSVDWDWSLRSHLVQGRYDRQAVPHST
jgi:hypothetical protein